jgi:hypothetical protein
MDLGKYHCTPMLRPYQRLMAADNTARLDSLARLRELKRAHGRDIRLFCAHDAQELDGFSRIGAEPASISPLPVAARR